MCYGTLRNKVTTIRTNNEPIIVTFPDVSFRELTYFEEELEMRKYIRDNPNQTRPTNMNYRQLRDELLTLSDEQLELTITVLNRDKEYFTSTIGGLYYSTEEDDYNEVLVAGHPYLMV